NLEEEISKIHARLQECRCKKLQEEKDAALEKAQNSPTAGEREKWSNEFQRLGRLLKKCEEEKKNPFASPCIAEEMRFYFFDDKKKKSPEEVKKRNALLKEMCSCLKKHDLPLPKECDEVTATLFPGDASVCNELKKDYDEKQKALQKAGTLQP